MQMPRPRPPQHVLGRAVHFTRYDPTSEGQGETVMSGAKLWKRNKSLMSTLKSKLHKVSKTPNRKKKVSRAQWTGQEGIPVSGSCEPADTC